MPSSAAGLTPGWLVTAGEALTVGDGGHTWWVEGQVRGSTFGLLTSAESHRLLATLSRDNDPGPAAPDTPWAAAVQRADTSFAVTCSTMLVSGLFAARGQLLAAPTADAPESQAEQSDVRRRLLHALDQLSAEQKAALVLVDIQGMSIDEAADVLECAPGTVKSRCSRGRHRLAELLGGSRAAFEGDSPQGTSPASRASKSVPSSPTHARGGDQS